MTQLAPDLFDRRFDELMEIGRAQLPSVAPGWTDHNAHDPGITLMELLAWVTEAELYSLSRQRRDERAAYAKLLGISVAGTKPARGLIWSDPLDLNSPAATFTSNIVITPDTVINSADNETPTFRPTHRLLWTPGHVESLEARLADGRVVDLTATNQRGGVAFLAFGENAGPHDSLRMTFACRGNSGLFPPNRSDAIGTLWSVGVRAALPTAETSSASEPGSAYCQRRLVVTLIDKNERSELEVKNDSSEGLMRTGVLLLSLDNITGSPQTFTIELRCPDGFPRPPRLLRIEPNVLPIIQGRSVNRELHPANGLPLPDWSFTLNVPGLRFDEDEKPLNVEVSEAAGLNIWEQRERVSDCGPDEPVYELDVNKGEVRFGNGVNGRIPPAGSQVFVSYDVCDGDQGNIARNRKWKVAGFGGVFGVNPDPITGGSASSDPIEQRREARLRSRADHALISSQDVVVAATGLSVLEVVRAWVIPPGDKLPKTGATTLVVMRERASAVEPDQAPETRRWLEAIRRRLVPRVPLGIRLIVNAPRYVVFSVEAKLQAEAGVNPSQVEQEVRKTLRKKLSLVDSADGDPPRRPGIPVTNRDVAAWIRGTNGVNRVIDVRLIDATGHVTENILVPRDGLPKWVESRSSITVQRSGPGGAA
jgi:predicted phage baseplate assembly protein